MRRMIIDIIDNSPLGFIFINDNNLIDYGNASFCNMVGLPKECVVGLSIGSIIHKDDLPKLIDSFSKLITNEVSNFVIELRLLRNDLKIIWVNMAVHAYKNTNNIPISGVVVVSDITKRKDYEDSELLT